MRYILYTGGKNVQSAVLRRQELAAKCGVTEREVEALVIEFNSMRKLMRQAFKVSLLIIISLCISISISYLYMCVYTRAGC